MEGNVLIPSENWVKMCQLQWTIKVSNTWREFGWRHLVRYFITPIQKRHRGGYVGGFVGPLELNIIISSGDVM